MENTVLSCFTGPRVLRVLHYLNEVVIIDDGMNWIRTAAAVAALFCSCAGCGQDRRAKASRLAPSARERIERMSARASTTSINRIRWGVWVCTICDG